MNTTSRLILTACASLAFAACSPRPHLTTQQVQNVSGLSMEEVKARLGDPRVVTDAGDHVWWDYDKIVMPNGNDDGTCQVIFKKDRVENIKC